ncbi:hypothetical protein D3C76_1096810 [compost metagenome]
MVTGQDELALAEQRLRQGAQVFFLDERALDDCRLAQLLAQVIEAKGLSQGAAGKQADAQQATQQRVHLSTLFTASSITCGEASCISPLAISTATCTELARVMRSPVAASLIR